MSTAVKGALCHLYQLMAAIAARAIVVLGWEIKTVITCDRVAGTCSTGGGCDGAAAVVSADCGGVLCRLGSFTARIAEP